jgi:hypothetical protein
VRPTVTGNAQRPSGSLKPKARRLFLRRSSFARRPRTDANRPLATAQGSDLTSVGGPAVADTSSGVTVAGGRQPPGTLPFIRGWTLDGHPTRRGRFGALL